MFINKINNCLQRFDLGSGPAIIMSSQPLEIGSSYVIYVDRYYNNMQYVPFTSNIM